MRDGLDLPAKAAPPPPAGRMGQGVMETKERPLQPPAMRGWARAMGIKP